VTQRARRAGAYLALVEGEQRETFKRFVEERIVAVHHIGEENVRRFAAQFERHRNEVLGGILHDLPAGRGFTGEGDFGDARARRERRADLRTMPVDHGSGQRSYSTAGPAPWVTSAPHATRGACAASSASSTSSAEDRATSAKLPPSMGLGSVK
jgi:hypothetical protein